MFSALLLLVIVGISALAWWLVGASRDRELARRATQCDRILR
jgi:cytoskeletal protein RodZ